MPKKKIEEVEEPKQQLPSDVIAEAGMLSLDRLGEVVYATTLPITPAPDLSRILFDVIELLKPVKDVNDKVRVLRAVAAYYDCSEDV